MKKQYRKGLVISWFYPPGNSSEGLVTYKLLKNSKYQYDVFTRGCQNDGVWDRNTDEKKLVSDNVTILQSKSHESDEWIEEVVKYFDENADKYDFIMSRIMPAEAHEAAARIKAKHPEVFWAASFGDPLVDSPYIEYDKKDDNPYYLEKYIARENPSKAKAFKLLISPTRNMRKYVWEKDRRDRNSFACKYKKINHDTFVGADLLIFNNKIQMDRAFSKDYSNYREKGVVINHSYDLDLYPKTKSNKDGKIHFLYVGHLDERRNALSLLEAIKSLKDNYKDLSKKAVFDFYGHMDKEDKSKIIDYCLTDCVKIHDNIDYLSSLEKISNSDWLVLIDTNLNKELDEYIYFPAKLADYMGSKKNILAITQLKGATADIVKKVECGKVVTHSAEDIYLNLAMILEGKMPNFKYNDSEWGKFDAKNVADKFDALIEQKLA